MNEQEKALQMMSEFYTWLVQRLGEDEFKALLEDFKQSKAGNIKTAKKGTKVDFFINKFANGGPNTADSLIRVMRAPVTKIHSAWEDRPTNTDYFSGMSDNTGNYHFSTNGRDSVYQWFPGEGGLIISNSGPNGTWVGSYSKGDHNSQVVNNFNNSDARRLSEELRQKMNFRRK